MPSHTGWVELGMETSSLPAHLVRTVVWVKFGIRFLKKSRVPLYTYNFCGSSFHRSTRADSVLCSRLWGGSAQCKQEDTHVITALNKKICWKWIGHVLRMDHRNIAQIAMRWIPVGEKKKDRPPKDYLTENCRTPVSSTQLLFRPIWSAWTSSKIGTFKKNVQHCLVTYLINRYTWWTSPNDTILYLSELGTSSTTRECRVPSFGWQFESPNDLCCT